MAKGILGSEHLRAFAAKKLIAVGETASFLCFSSDFRVVHLFCSAADATGRIDGVHGNDRGCMS